MDPVDRSNAASSSHQPTSANSSKRQRLLAELSPGASTASPRIPAATQPPVDSQDHIRKLQPQGPPAELQLSNREQMEQALNTWAQNGLPNENRSTAASSMLEAFDTNNSRLDLGGLHLQSLPEEIGNLTGLSWLELSSNQLPQLPESFGNLTGLSRLLLYDNHLTQLPDSFGNLTGLSWLDLSDNQLTQLPESFGNLTGLSRLDLSDNQLPQLPDAFGNLTGLSVLDLSDNHLTQLPDAFGNLTGLSVVDLSDNQLTQLPQSIFGLPGRTEIDLEQNLLSQQTIVELSQQTAGPHINFSIFETAAGGQQQVDFESEIRHYCSQIAPDQLANLQNSENADAFGQLLAHLGSTAEARHPGFQQRVAAVVETLAEAGSAELRAKCYLMAHDGLGACGDRVAITFGNIEVNCKVRRISQAGGGHEQMADLLRGLFRMNALDNFARTDIAGRQGGVDQIEVFLAYRVGLKDELHLPCETGAMLYQSVSGVDQQKLDCAKAHVLSAESAGNGANLVEFAIAQPFWKEYIESNPSYRQAGQRIDENSQARLADLDNRRETISDTDYFSQLDQILAQREPQLKELRREYTRRMRPR